MTETVQELRERQKNFAKELHGDQIVTDSSFKSILSKNNNSQKNEVDKYWSNWDGKTDDKAMQKRLNDYNESTHSYYNLVTDFYEYGWGKSFHFCRFHKGESFQAAIARHEHYLAMMANINENDLVLDVGCGVGGPANEIVNFTNCKVIGVNNNDYQIERANFYAKRNGLQDNLNFVKSDFMNLTADFSINTFDKVYAIEATVHAPDLQKCYSEIFKVLKPGGTFAVYEWVMTDKYDESNEEHRKIAYEIELGDGIPKMYTVDVARKALIDSGFEIKIEKDLADVDDEIPWYYPLTGDWKYIQSLSDLTTFFRTSYIGRKLTTLLLSTLEKIHLAPQGSVKITETLENAAVGLVKGGEEKLFTPMMLFVAKKPESSN